MMKRYGHAALALLFWAGAMTLAPHAQAQHDAAIATVKDHFQTHQARYGASADDLSDLVVTDAYVSRRSGATYVYLRQAHDGIPVINAPAQAAVARDGRLVAPHARFISGLADRVNTTRPALTAAGAADAAIPRLQREAERPDVTPTLTDMPGETAPDRDAPYGFDEFVPNLEHARLALYATEQGPVRLVWELLIETRDHNHLFHVYVDTETGMALYLKDAIERDTWNREARAAAAAPVNLAPVAPETASLTTAASGTYNVFAWPAESPSHGPQILVTNPHDPTASQLGWHDTGSINFTITRGNNVWAYEDRSDTGSGTSPDGGASLVFDFPFDPTQQPVEYQDLAVTNLFYWNNIVHDLTYLYGFDEASGNYQVNNFGLGGLGGDLIRAEAQDGSGTDNANFSPSPDGAPGRMQMYEWTPGTMLEVVTPTSIAGSYPHGGAQFGPLGGYMVTDEAVAVEDLFGELGRGCTADDVGNGAALSGNIALVERGDCNFVDKARVAESFGAVGVIVYNCEPGALGCSTNNPGEGIITMALPDGEPNDVNIPALFLPRSSGQLVIDNSPGVTIRMEQGSISRDSDLDAGIIAHEYAHGISHRLTGGPSNSPGCLSGDEQMGEGWSDFYGLILTMQDGDTAEQPRGVGTYVEFEPIDGLGIRPTPYSTDTDINPATYGDTVPLVTGQQHTVGYVWATILWEAMWDLINTHGFDQDLYNPDASAGNQMMLNLVTEGMKIQPCNPGFVDGRDAILAADTLLYGGTLSNTLWQSFARRGLGVDADQGTSAINADNVENFDLPDGINVGIEGEGGLPVAYRLSQAYPNPFNPSAQFTLEVSEAQPVRIELLDVLGRQVALLHDGDLAAGTTHRFTIDGRALASGVYTYRVSGETFTAAERVTLLK